MEESPVPELVVTSQHKAAPGEEGVEEDVPGAESPAMSPPRDPNAGWTLRCLLNLEGFAPIPPAARVVRRTKHTAAFNFDATEGRRPRTPVLLKVRSPPRSSSPISPGDAQPLKGARAV